MSEQTQILCVDDEPNVLRAIERIFIDDDLEVITAGSGAEGLEELAANPGIKLVVSDYRMPGMNGVEFLREVCGKYPDTIRMVLSGYADTAAVVDAINEGQIYKFMPKPWNDEELRVNVLKALDVYELQHRNQALTIELAAVNSHLTELNESLEHVVSERTAELKVQNHALNQARNILHHLPVGVISIDSNAVIAQCNLAAASLLGKSDPGSLLSQPADMVLPLDIYQVQNSVARTGETVCIPLQCEDAAILVRGMLMREDGKAAVILVLTRLGASDEESCHV